MYNLILFSYFTMLVALSSMAMDNNKLPGSRNIYVANHDSQKELDYLKLFLKECRCEQNSPTTACNCWLNYNESDQPMIQGDARISLLGLNSFKYGGPLGFFLPENNSILIPNPQLLKSILNTMNLGHLIELVDGDDTLDVWDYLKLLSKEKIPVAKIAKAKVNGDNSMSYSLYFHDYFNHLILWVHSPYIFRHLISSRTQSILDLFADIRNKETQTSTLIIEDLMQLIAFATVTRLDISMGMMNFYIFNPKDSQLNKNITENISSLDTNNTNVDKIITTNTGSAINFGYFRLGLSDYIYTIKDPNAFLYTFIDHSLDNILSLFKNLNNKDNTSFALIESDKLSNESFKRLANINVNDLSKACQEIKDIAAKQLDKNRVELLNDVFLSTHAFIIETKVNIRNFLLNWKKVLEQSEKD
jgi:hypothetical protein